MSENKLLNGCDLLNRHELSRSQDRELRRFIDNNLHLLHLAPREEETGKQKIKKSRYADVASQLHRGVRFANSSFERPSEDFDKFSRFDQTISKPSEHSINTQTDTARKNRKEVKWYDRQLIPYTRTRSLSPDKTDSSPRMYHYGSTGNLNRKLDSSFYDDYNRFETARQRYKREMQNRREEQDRSRFPGYGDRPGSGIEFAPHHWHGGEIVDDPTRILKSLKPKRIYYSPIGDGVVAADGVELKQTAKDISPRISITHMKTYDRGEPGQDGYNIYEKIISMGGSDYGSDYGGGSGRNSRTAGAFSPGLSAGSDRYGHGPAIGIDSGSGAPSKETHDIDRHPIKKDHWIPEKEPHQARNLTNDARAFSDSMRPDGTKFPPTQYVDNQPANDARALSDSMRPDGTKFPPIHYGDTRGSQITPNKGSRYYEDPTNVQNFSLKDPYSNVFIQKDHYAFSPKDLYGTIGSTKSDPFAAYGGSLSQDNLADNDGYSTRSRPIDGRSSAGSGIYGTSLDGRRYDVQTDYLITNPRELIHQYATTTPVAVLDTSEGATTKTVRKLYSSTTEEKYVPYPPYKASSSVMHPTNFARQLRDENLTVSQREANRHQEPLNLKDSTFNNKVSEIRHQATKTLHINDIDYLTEKMMYGLQTGHPTPPPL